MIENLIEIWVCASVMWYAGILIMTAIFDMAVFRIPNSSIIMLFLVFFFSAWAMPFQSEMWVGHGLGFFIAFVVGVLIWRLGMMGGGDVKLIATLGLWTGINGLPGLLLVIALTGGVFTVFLIIVRHGVRQYWSSSQLPTIFRQGEPIPYGVAIACSGLMIMPYIPLFKSALEGIVK